MRISVDPADAGYTPDGWRYEVLLNGVVQGRAAGRAVVTADDAAGMIWFWAVDSKGRPTIAGLQNASGTVVIRERGAVS